jgi:AhpD family alkylhydroperoxidase
MATNPAVLKGYIELNGALGTTLTRELNEQIAIAVAEENGCRYCLSAHTALGGLVGVDKHELARSRAGESADTKVAAALKFAQTVNAKRGDVSDDDLAAVRAAGYDDGDIAAIVGHVALNVLTNYFNLVARTVIEDTLFGPFRRTGSSSTSTCPGYPSSSRSTSDGFTGRSVRTGKAVRG